jgi:uncharacterized circularly permuted ATP-grasp superfamily protein/uncharacterized alpha-E superfamily protein
MQQLIENPLLIEYLKQINSYDEVLDSEGNVKAYWSKLFDILAKIGITELKKRDKEIIRKLRENGVTYNVYGSTDGLNRQWQLDPIPFVLSREEWAGINDGIVQRAQLQDLIIKDLYGPRNLIKDKIIPPELLYANSGFLRPCFELQQNSIHHVLVYAADIARGPDGRMWVIDNRTQTPSGYGYAFENRKVLSRVMPELAENIFVDRITPFYQNFHKLFFKLSNKLKEQPFVVFLTPGPHNETYFEQAYLSSYFGCTLVHGDDLLVRDGFVWLKSIQGLQKVDVIIRRVDDDFVDPLELRQDSRLGIPGLLQVIRKGNVALVNPPGTGILENHGFLAYANPIANYFFGTDLKLPSVATWWCGQEKELQFVLNNIERLIIKNINRKQSFKSVYGRMISKTEREEVKLMILKSPHEFVAQEEVQLSTTPSFTGENIEPRLAAIRSFVVSDGDSYRTMQGGLTRSSPIKDRFIISNQHGGLSKDTWIVSDQPELSYDAVKLSINVNSSIDNNVLSSRSAENLYWAGRYCERTQVVSNILNNTINTLITHKRFSDQSKDEHIDILLKTITHITTTYPGFLEIHLATQPEEVTNELLEVISNENKIGSVVYTVNNFLNATINIRERLTIGTFKILDLINGVNKSLKNKNNSLAQNQELLERLNMHVFTFIGIVNETMTRDSGMHIFEIGKLIERCHLFINQIRSCLCMKFDGPIEEEMLESLLLNNYSLLKYRSKYKTEIKMDLFLDMMLLETNLPHSIFNQLNRISECIDSLPKQMHTSRLNEAQKIILLAIALIQKSDVSKLAVYNKKDLFRDNLDRKISKIDELLNKLSLVISNIYFNHTLPNESNAKVIEADLNYEI